MDNHAAVTTKGRQGRLKNPATDRRVSRKRREEFSAMVDELRGKMAAAMTREADVLDDALLDLASFNLAMVLLFKARIRNGWIPSDAESKHIASRALAAREAMAALGLNASRSAWGE